MDTATSLNLSPIDHVLCINRTWIVHGNLSQDTANYLAGLEKRNPAACLEACTLALAAARQSSREQRDPKPDFYATLFRYATPGERERYLSDHPWTLRLSAQPPAGQS